ncbi:MAG: GNAT family N-acetyltransferase [Myxococcus sp.]|nr:GNAT family N-acetyltransferase [Myxococcus sp.]
MPAPLSLKVLDAISEVPKEAWNRLLAPGEAPVTRWEWIDAMEQSGSAVRERGWQAHHLTLWRGETLVATLPAYLKFHSMGEYVYDFGWANAAQQFGVRYYPKLLIGMPLSPVTARKLHVAGGEDVEAVRGVMMTAALELAKDVGASSVHVLFPHEDEALALEQLGFFRRATLQYHWRNPGYRTYDDYLSRFDAKRRHQLKRERGAAAQQGLMLRTVRSAELTGVHASLAARFYEATASRHAWGPVQLTPEFFQRAFSAMPDAIELVVAERGRQVVAGAFNLHSPTHLFGRYWGAFEEHPFLHFNVCLYHSIDDCIAAGRVEFEPGAGGEHKISRGFQPTRVHSAHRLLDARFEQAVRRACDREAAEVDRVVAESLAIAGMKPWGPR